MSRAPQRSAAAPALSEGGEPVVFSSLTFLFLYLPIVLVLYFLTPLRWRNLTLLIVSLFFYAWGEPVYISIMFLSILIDYTHGMLVEKYRARDRLARWFVTESVIFNLLLLGFFKYWDFFAANLSLLPGIHLPQLGLSLPIGISFFTFQTMSYTIDVYRQDAPVQRNPITFGTFVTMFPQLIAGPIVKYKTVAAELESRVCTPQEFAGGVQRFCVGLAKKVLLANSIGALWDSSLAAQAAGTLTVGGGWLGLVAYSFQIYFDFSGYSDMAIGLGRMLGFHFDENFRYPYMAVSVTDFWRRWHISLTSWFREYLYIPLGGNRGGTAKALRNIFIVWLCTGFWHGADWNFILWGLYFAVLLTLEKYVLRGVLDRTPQWLRRIYTLFCAVVGWGLFAMTNLGQCAAYFRVCFGGGPVWSAASSYALRSYAVTLAVLALASTTLGVRAWGHLSPRVRRVVCPVLTVACLVICTAYLVDGSYNPFLYFRF
jgi:alginate O-acetyltransferase complex protein AlgI